MPDEKSRPETVLIVCSANRCRSPLAAALLRRELGGRDVEVLDAGFGTAGIPVTSATLEVAAELGLDLGSHESATLDAESLDDADLVICMERAHVREVVVAYPGAWPKTFTLKELVRRADARGPRVLDAPLSEWLATLHQGRTRAELLGASLVDDVADPTTDLRVDHATTASELEDLCAAVVEGAWSVAG